MASRLKKIQMWFFMVALCVFHPGCPAHYDFSSQFGEESWEDEGVGYDWRLKLEKIGVVSSKFLPQVEFDMPPAGALSGAARGAELGAPLGAAILSLGGGGGAVGVILIAAGAIVGGTMGSIYGAVASEPTDTVEDAEELLKQALEILKISENMRKHVLTQAQTKTQYEFIELSDVGPSSESEILTYQELKEKGLDSVLEIQVLKLGLEEVEYEEFEKRELTPPLVMYLEVRASLIQVGSSDALYVGISSYKTDPHPYEEWAADEAKLFRDSLDAAYRNLAGEIVWKMF